MTVFQNRVAAAYRRKRSVKQMAIATVVIILVVLSLGIAGFEDYQEQESPLFARNF